MLLYQDSLWAAEDIEAVFDQDPQRVCILQGPMAVKHSKVKDEPIKELLGGINSSLIELLLERRYGGDATQIPVVDYLGAKPAASPLPAGVSHTKEGSTVTLTLGEALPLVADWLKTLAGSELNWLYALVSSTTITQGSAYINNPLRRLLIPRPNQKVVTTYSGSVPTSLVIYGAARSFGLHQPDFKAVEITYETASKSISLTMNEERRGVSVPLSLQFVYKPEMGSAPIHEVAEGRNTRIKEFYWKLWYGDDQSLPEIDVHDTFVGPNVTINAADVERFCSIVGNQDQAFKSARSDKVQAPMDFAIVTGWQVSFPFNTLP